MRLVVITGAGRSGGAFFSELLKRARNLAPEHERIGERDLYCVSAYDPSHPSVRRELERGVARARAAGAWQCVVEVNSDLCFAIEELKALAPDVQVFHLARSGRDVIAANWRRQMYVRSPDGIDVRPSTDAGVEVFDRYDRFQKLAWQWSRIVSGLNAQGAPVIRFEDALSDFGYLERVLLAPAGIDLPKAAWNELRVRRILGSGLRIDALPRPGLSPLIWTARREAQFRALCGASMRALGYDLGTASRTGPAWDALSPARGAAG
jgi:hypothetical protein